MKIYMFFLLFISFFFYFNFSFASDNIIISQFQTSGISATDEFIELYNPTNVDIDLFDYKIQKRSSSSATYNIVSAFPEKSIIKAFSYFLVAHKNFSLQNFIKPDFVYSNYSIASDNSILLYDSDSSIIDSVGFGNCSYSESGCLVNIISNQSYIRSNDYNSYGYGYGYGSNAIKCEYWDTNINKTDFILLSKSSPRNSLFKNECFYTEKLVTNTTDKDISADSKLMQNDFINIFTEQNNIGINPISVGKSFSSNVESVDEDFDNYFYYDDTIAEKSSIVSVNDNVLSVDINEIQDLDVGNKIKTIGVVIAIPGSISSQYFYLNGVQVYNSKSEFPKLNIGDSISVYGEISSNYGEKRIKVKNISDIKILSKNNKISVFDPCSDDNITANLVRSSGYISKKSSNKIYLVKDDCEVTVSFTSYLSDVYKSLKTGDYINVVGVFNKRNDAYRILPRITEDVVISNKDQMIEGVDYDDVVAAGISEDQLMIPNEEDAISNMSKTNVINNNDVPQKNYYSIRNVNHDNKLFFAVVVFVVLFMMFIFLVVLYKKGILIKIITFFKLKSKF